MPKPSEPSLLVALALALVASAYGNPAVVLAEDEPPIVFSPGITTSGTLTVESSNGSFSDSIPDHVVPGDRLRFSISSSDPRVIWSLSINYEQPASDQLRAQLAAVVRVVAGGGAMVSASPDDAEGLARRVQELVNRLAGDLLAFVASPASSSSSIGSIRTATEGLGTQYRALAALVHGLESTSRPPFQPVLRRAERTLRAADAVLRFVNQAERSRTQTARVRSGYGVMTVRVCARTLTIADEDVVTSPIECSDAVLRLAVSEPLLPLSVQAGVLVPFYFQTPRAFSIGEGDALVEGRSATIVGPVSPALSVGVRALLDRPSLASLGIDLSMGVGERIGRAWGLGPAFSVYGIGLAAGLYVDFEGDTAAREAVASGTIEQRTEAVPIGGFYIRLALTADLLEAIAPSEESSVAGEEADTAQPPEPSGSDDASSSTPDPAPSDDGASSEHPQDEPDGPSTDSAEADDE